MTVSTHVLDATAGRPAAGVVVSLWQLSGGGLGEPGAEWVTVAGGETGADGRHRFEAATEPGVYRLVFGTGLYFEALGVETFYPEVTITFSVSSAGTHYHVPLLLSPYGYSTYRGS
jgi:5-hydroxyisourate hydrolase